MRKQLKRNKRKMYYALYDKQMPVGDDVLECKAGYKKPVIFRASLSTGQSNAQENPFGTSVDYDRIICSTDMRLPITETTLLWIGKEPSYLDDGSVDPSSANYKVAAHPLDGMQSLRIAVKLIAQSVVEDMEQEKDNTTGEPETDPGSDLEDW